MKIDVTPPLAEVRAALKAEVEAEARAQRAQAMPLDRLLALLADAIASPSGTARQQVEAWRARRAEIDAAEADAHAAIDAATTVGEARRVKPDWNTAP